MEYKCDRCGKSNSLDESKVRDKQDYIQPHGCYGGDYYVHHYFWFPCSCGRALKVRDNELKEIHSVEKDYTPHVGVCNCA